MENKNCKKVVAKMEKDEATERFAHTIDIKDVSDTPITVSSLGAPLFYRGGCIALDILRDRRTIVKDVKIIAPNKVVEVIFEDGSKQKSICAESDTFSLELAISFCITKNLMGGTSNYNKAIDYGMKVYENNLAKQKADKAEEERIKTKKAKMVIKRNERIARRKAEEMERMIEIQKEAIIRANRETTTTAIGTY